MCVSLFLLPGSPFLFAATMNRGPHYATLPWSQMSMDGNLQNYKEQTFPFLTLGIRCFVSVRVKSN